MSAVHLVGFAEIGTYLREAREALDLPLERPARDLHLGASYLEWIEEGRPDALPGLAYAKGYTKKYADYLGLDGGLVMRAFEQAMHFRDPVDYPAPTRREARPHRVLLLLCAVALLLLMGAWRLLWPAQAAQAEMPTVASFAPPGGPARACWSHLPRTASGPACFSAPLSQPLRPAPVVRYGTEMQLPMEERAP